MSDDIVTRLREALETDESILLTMPRPTVRMIADEIERLRALINHGLTDAYRCAGCDLCEQLKAMHLQAVKP